jgi:hypothetical protein
MDRLNLGIIGSEDKGDFIINWLESLGGDNVHSLTGNNNGCVYSVDLDTKEIVSNFNNEFYQKMFFKIYDVDTFKAEYPFCVGDIIKFPNEMAEEITKVRWDDTLGDIIYTSASGLERTLKMEEKIIKKIDLTDKHYDNEVELVLGENQEAIIEKGKVKIIKKLYPYTYKECCEVLGLHISGELLYDSDEDLTTYENQLVDKLDALRKIIICRDAYRKIYRDEHGETEKIYTIQWDSKSNNIIKKTNLDPLNIVLSFYTEDMRDTFARKFDEDIKKCKELI